MLKQFVIPIRQPAEKNPLPHTKGSLHFGWDDITKIRHFVLRLLYIQFFQQKTMCLYKTIPGNLRFGYYIVLVPDRPLLPKEIRRYLSLFQLLLGVNRANTSKAFLD